VSTEKILVLLCESFVRVFNEDLTNFLAANPGYDSAIGVKIQHEDWKGDVEFERD